MTTVANLRNVQILSNQLTEVSAAITALQAGGSVVAIVITDPTSSPAVGRTVSGLSLSPPGLLTMLQTRQTALTNQLAAMGITPT